MNFQKAQQSNESIIQQLRDLEEQNRIHEDSINEKNKMLKEFSNRITAMKARI